MSFSDNFVWGAAAASFQIEGANQAKERGWSVWDEFSHTPHKTYLGETGDDACDHVNRYQEDVQLMAKMNLKAYRLSISWPRVLPNGVGEVNDKGLAFYDQLVDELLGVGIEPWVTLFHWDYPYALYQKGGWLNPDSPKWFAEYTKIVVDKLSDRVKNWFTLNEPQCFIGLGHLDGKHAPGLQLGWREVLLANHHALLAHGYAVKAIRENSKQRAMVGAAPIGIGFIPYSLSQKDVDAARKATNTILNKDVWNTTLFADPIILGKYPDEAYEIFAGDMPKTSEEDFRIMKQSLDFFGMNIYQSTVARANGMGDIEVVPPKVGANCTQMGWVMTPESLYYVPKFFYERYQLPIVITENGMANNDMVQADGSIQDQQRIAYMNAYLLELKKASAEIPIKGYFHWSLMDNFEWAFGYAKRFGLIHVDFATQKRTLKESALWYGKVIESNGSCLTPIADRKLWL